MRYHVGRLRQLVLEAFSKAYDILGVTPSASRDEIKQAYKRQAVGLHPDRNPGDRTAADKMVKLNVAYDLLSDPEKRRKYDMMGDRTLGDRGSSGSASSSDEPWWKRSSTRVNLQQCPRCKRQVNVQYGRFVNHFTQQGVTTSAQVLKADGKRSPKRRPSPSNHLQVLSASTTPTSRGRPASSGSVK